MITRDLDSIGHLLFGKTRQAVLGLLFTRPDESFHLRQIVRLSGSGLGPVQREVVKLAAAGVLLRQQRGRQIFYNVNAQSPIYEELRGIVLKTAGLADVLRAALLPLASHIRCAFIFGSFAVAKQHRESDVDLLVVGDMTFAELARALAEPQRRLGREINPSVYSPGELARKLTAGHHFVTQVLAGPKIYLVGSDDELSRMAEERVASPASDQPAGNRGAVRGHRS